MGTKPHELETIDGPMDASSFPWEQSKPPSRIAAAESLAPQEWEVFSRLFNFAILASTASR